VFLAYDNQKEKLLIHILNERKDYDSIIVFTSSKSKVSEIVRSLKRSGFKAQGISSNLNQEEREEALRGFRSKRIRIVVATDVMSRGIDVKEINMVVNFDVPHDAEDYVHRVGRTARANTKGEAITIVNPKDMLKFYDIEKLIGTAFEKQAPPKKLGKGPEWSTNKPKFGRKKKFFKKK
jgi:superfamily II DNA/RNA helicase